MPTERKTRHWQRWVLIGLVALVALLVAATAAGSWYFSSLLLEPEHGEDYDLRVQAAPAGRVVLERTQDTVRPGTYGLDWKGGHGVLGRERSIRDDEVTRELRLTHGRLAADTKVAIDPDVYEGNPRQALGIPFRRVPVRGELGVMPAWRVEGGPTWAIFVHGIDGTPEAGLRILPTLRRAGLTTLLITYRNDPGAPRSPDGLHHLGLTEWRDLQAAARYARSQGARRLIVVGQSMGGAIVTQFMERSRLARHVAGLVLDAPALSWKPILELDATERGLPSFVAEPVEWVVGLRIEVNWNRLDALDHTDDLRLPILLFHGTEDTVVPIETSEALARKLPRYVTFHRIPRAGHVESWNVNPR
ncbi:MAG: lysophospholipase, partial [Actinomycetota bacterium]|nr:lysophospholipase [Actinomycetota bacterium]